jgi:hypothetical protein
MNLGTLRELRLDVTMGPNQVYPTRSHTFLRLGASSTQDIIADERYDSANACGVGLPPEFEILGSTKTTYLTSSNARLHSKFAFNERWSGIQHV